MVKQILLTGGTKEDYEKSLAMFKQLLNAFSEPIIVFRGGWANSLTKEQKEKVSLERLKQLMESKGEPIREATDYEACLYFMTASLEQPLTTQATRLYMYVFKKVFPEKFDTMFGEQGNLELKLLSEYDLNELKRFKVWLLKKRNP